jgi:hypothetical protein
LTTASPFSIGRANASIKRSVRSVSRDEPHAMP